MELVVASQRNLRPFSKPSKWRRRLALECENSAVSGYCRCREGFRQVVFCIPFGLPTQNCGTSSQNKNFGQVFQKVFRGNREDVEEFLVDFADLSKLNQVVAMKE
ncbi:uncharacterized protein [Physcomitrium patens]|uniref:uncharacterized protein n=1 Tax=Physcomitrium patens TaxID=3218 RepID=UPI003CCE0882